MVQIVKEEDNTFSYYVYKGKDETEEDLLLQGFDFVTQEEILDYFKDLKMSLEQINIAEG